MMQPLQTIFLDSRSECFHVLLAAAQLYVLVFRSLGMKYSALPMLVYLCKGYQGIPVYLLITSMF